MIRQRKRNLKRQNREEIVNFRRKMNDGHERWGNKDRQGVELG